jgi:hypothetical protein
LVVGCGKLNYSLHRLLRSSQIAKPILRSNSRLRYQSRKSTASESGQGPSWGDMQGWSRDDAVVAVLGSDVPDRAPLLRSKIRLTQKSNSSTKARLWAEYHKTLSSKLQVHVCLYVARSQTTKTLCCVRREMTFDEQPSGGGVVCGAHCSPQSPWRSPLLMTMVSIIHHTDRLCTDRMLHRWRAT